MVQGVPAIGVMAELIQLCALYGVVEEYRPLDEYPAEEFTEVYLVKFQRLTSARYERARGGVIRSRANHATRSNNASSFLFFICLFVCLFLRQRLFQGCQAAYG